MTRRIAKSPLDRLFLREDERWPWTIHAEMALRERVDLDRVREAVAGAVARHVMLRARTDDRASADWVVDDETPVTVDVVAVDDGAELDSTRADLLSEPMDLGTAPAARFVLLRTATVDRLVVLVHHAVADGVGVLRFAESIALAYGGHRPVAAVPERLPRLPALEGPWGPGAPDVLRRLRRTVKHRPAALVPEGGDEDAVGYGYCRVVVPEQLTSLCRAPAVAVNDLLLASLHLAVARWNEARGHPGDKISVAMPVNLRPLRQWGEGVCNLALAWPVHSRPEQRSDPRDLLEVVAGQTRRVRFGLRSHDCAVAAAAVLGQSMPPLWAQLALQQSTLLSNMGDLSAQLDEAVCPLLTDVVASVPPTRAMGISFIAWMFSGELSLAARYRREVFSGEAAHEVLQLVLACCDEIAEPAGVGMASGGQLP